MSNLKGRSTPFVRSNQKPIVSIAKNRPGIAEILKNQPSFSLQREKLKNVGGRPSNQAIGANVGGLLGGIAGSMTPLGPVGGAIGSILGQQAGPAVVDFLSPEEQEQQPQQQQRAPQTPGAPSALNTSKNANLILESLRALEDHPSLARKFTSELTQAYIQSQIDLKQMG